MKHKKVIILICVLAFVILTIACLWKPLRMDRFGQAMIDWVDVIQYKNESYISAYPRIEISPENIGINIGKVHFMLSGNVGNPNYKLMNFDAAYLPKNTELFLIKNEPDSIAALVDGVYYEFKKHK